MVEALWKYLIYTEVAISIFTSTSLKPTYYQPTTEERNLLDFMSRNGEVFSKDFASRLDSTIRTLCEVNFGESDKENKTRISEILHNNLLGKLRELIGGVLKSKTKVLILIDNLDKAWKPREDVDKLARFLFGLLSVGQSIANDFQKSGFRKDVVNLSMVIFLRSDIFWHLRPLARERDKLDVTRISWNDSELLKAVVADRFAASISSTAGPEEIWATFFTDRIGELTTSDYIIEHIIPRPRDLLYLCKSALSRAVNRRQPKIQEDDLVFAENAYSAFAYDTLLAELAVDIPSIEAIVIEFAGCDEIVTKSKVLQFIGDSIATDKIEYSIELLIESNFLGLETSLNKFEFSYDESRKSILNRLAENVFASTGVQRFRIHPAFHRMLSIKTIAV